MTEPAVTRAEVGRDVKAEKRAAAAPRGLTIRRYFTRPGVDPFDEVEWELRNAVITGEKGEIVFEQKNVEIPKQWSQLATSVVVSKYFRGALHSAERERSVKQLIGRADRRDKRPIRVIAHYQT